MTKYEIWECDRCEEEMKQRPEDKPHQLLVVKDEITYDLCEDCFASFSYFLMYPKEFDALADKLCKKKVEE